MSLGNNNGNLMESINRVISEPYYLLHFLAFFSYIPIRCSASNVFSPLRSSHLLYRVLSSSQIIFHFISWTRLIYLYNCFCIFLLDFQEIQAALAFFVLSAVKVGIFKKKKNRKSDILFSFLVILFYFMHLLVWGYWCETNRFWYIYC